MLTVLSDTEEEIWGTGVLITVRGSERGVGEVVVAAGWEGVDGWVHPQTIMKKSARVVRRRIRFIDVGRGSPYNKVMELQDSWRTGFYVLTRKMEPRLYQGPKLWYYRVFSENPQHGSNPKV